MNMWVLIAVDLPWRTLRQLPIRGFVSHVRYEGNDHPVKFVGMSRSYIDQ